MSLESAVAQLAQRLDDPCQRLEEIEVLGGEMVRTGIRQAQRAHQHSVAIGERIAEVRMDVRIAEDQRAVREPGILARVRNQQATTAPHDVIAEGDMARCFRDVDPHRRQEPLAVPVHQRNGRDAAREEIAA